MTVAVAVRTSRTRLVFDGQSLNIQPGVNIAYPRQLRNLLGDIVYNVPAIGDCAFSDLINDFGQRTAPYATKGQRTILMMNGGTNDALSGSNGATIYATFGTYAATARTAGFGKVIANTIPPNVGSTGSFETARTTANSLILADASHYFDATADFASDSRLSDYTNLTYYSDGIHWTTAGCQAAASIMAPVARPFI
jgi:lysophospholipase L1-like esterase